MRFIFRADASPEIGSGHVMRSSVVAAEAIKRGYECYFVGKVIDLGWVNERIQNLGFYQICESFADLKVENSNAILFLDSYTINEKDLDIQQENWLGVVIIKDETTPSYSSDIQIQPGFDISITGQADTKVLSGPKYALIRDGIIKAEISNGGLEVLRVLVVAGGSDPFNFAEALANLLDSFCFPMEVHFFSSKHIVSNSENSFVTHDIGFGLDKIVNQFDLVFTTASTSSLEFVAREIPTAIACAAGNQESLYRQLNELGYAVAIGRHLDDSSWHFNIESIKNLLTNFESRANLIEKTRGVIDGKGASRILDEFESHFKK